MYFIVIGVGVIFVVEIVVFLVLIGLGVAHVVEHLLGAGFFVVGVFRSCFMLSQL